MSERTQVGHGADTSTTRDLATDATAAPPPSNLPTDATVASSASPVVTIRPGGTNYESLVVVDRAHYAFGEEIARGGMGRIIAARDRRLGRTVAIKELLVDTGDLRARFEREALITANLQHPAIVNLLEAGKWSTGEPFYVMKLVTGEPLDKVIARTRTLNERLALLPSVIAVVEALAYAHSHQVIHRDLKPANVLVGKFGETVVIDWGLAKDLSASDDALASTSLIAPSGTETLVGSVMGTPSYMPVEQAQGDPVDARADVYALGAIVYHALSGTPPYTGRTADEILKKVIAGPPRSLREAAPGVPDDLVALVDKAMAYDAADRYATAAELADDLKKFQTGQLVGAHRYTTGQLVRRWLARHRGAVLASAVGIATLAVVGGLSLRSIFAEQARTEEQRRVAVEHQADAEGLIDFMLYDLKKKLEPIGRIELLDAVVTKAAEHYAKPRPDESVEDEARRAATILAIGEVRAVRGELTAAADRLREAMAIREDLAARGKPSTKRDQAYLHDALGRVLISEGDVDGGRAELERAVALADGEAGLSTPLWELTRFYQNRNDMAATIAAGERGLAIADAANDYERAAGFHIQLANTYSDNNEPTKAASEARLAIAAFNRPGTAETYTVLEGLAGAHSVLGAALIKQDDVKGAIPEIRAALELAERRRQSDPLDVSAKRQVAAAHEQLAEALVAAGNPSEGLAEMKLAIAQLESLVAQVPGDTSWMSDLSITHERYANLLFEAGQLPSAADQATAGLAIADVLLKKDPDNIAWLANRQSLYFRRARALGASDFARGESDFKAALVDAERIVAKQPTHHARHDFGAVHSQHVTLLLTAKRFDDEALAEARLVEGIFQKLADEQPKEPNALHELGNVQLDLIDVLNGRKQYADAAGVGRTAIGHYETLRAMVDNPALMEERAGAYDRLATALRGTGDSSGADGATKTALALHQQAKQPQKQ